MAVLSPALLIGFFLVVPPLLLSEAKATTGIQEGKSSDQTLAEEQEQALEANIKELIEQNKLSRSSRGNTCKDSSFCGVLLWWLMCYNSELVRKHCRVTCGTCPCTDNHFSRNDNDDCMFYASKGFCSHHDTSIRSYMQEHCRRSCNFCSSCKCGQANYGSRNRIAGGGPTYPNEFPWQVYLIALTSNNKMQTCGGSIISNKEILTAAHCIWDGEIERPLHPEDIRVLVGLHDMSKLSEMLHTQPNVEYKVCEANRHPLNERSTFDYDFAILTLCDSLEFDEVVSPVCLPRWESDFRYTDPSTVFYNDGLDNIVSGWGELEDGTEPKRLHKMTVQTLSNEECDPEIHKTPLYDGGTLTSRMICGVGDYQGVCHGDSGGPWVIQYERNYILTGITSWAPIVDGESCNPGIPSVAARVSGDELIWIKNNMKGETCPRDPRPL